ncbi:MAG TPA: hypothetical protein VHX52_14080 [Steroidobacteraceae bacterium]|nr:hypothetical protein [Steroidobacteraceae bacterium]
MPKTVSKVIGILALSLCFGTAAYAGSWNSVNPPSMRGSADIPTLTSAPEIDPSSAFAGLTLLLGGLAVVRGRRVKK